MIVCVVQARMSSRRLPGKVLADVAGRPMLERQCERLARARRVERLVVATSDEASDDAVEGACEGAGIACHRGSLEDVLGRVLAAARDAAHVVRATADCPLADPSLVDAVIATHLAGAHDYTSNTLERTYPDGLDIEVARRAALADAASRTVAAADREHVTPYLYSHPERYSLGSVTDDVDRGHLRWTVDDADDLAFVRAVFEELYPLDAAFTTDDVHALLARRPELVRTAASGASG